MAKVDNPMIVAEIGITPSGTVNIAANGTYDVTEKASAVVNVPNPSTGSLAISANGTYDVTEKASAVVSVRSGVVVLGALVSVYTGITASQSGNTVTIGA